MTTKTAQNSKQPAQYPYLKGRLNHNKPYLLKNKTDSMTICIASICNIDNKNGKVSPAIVFCADRLLSSSINFEHGNPKIKYIKNRCVIMEAGDGTTSDLVLNKSILGPEESDKLSELDISEIAEMINDNLLELKESQIETKVLSDFGLSLEDFYDSSINLDERLLSRILMRMEDVKDNLQLDFIIAGLDKDGTAQLYRVSSEEGIQCYNTIGFVAIGSGTPLSLLELTKSEHNNYIDVEQAIFKVYSAKKGAEKVAGVGRKTDLGILFLESADREDKNWRAGIIETNDKTKESLDGHINDIQNYEKNKRDAINTDIRKLIFGEIFVDPEKETTSSVE